MRNLLYTLIAVTFLILAGITAIVTKVLGQTSNIAFTIGVFYTIMYLMLPVYIIPRMVEADKRKRG